MDVGECVAVSVGVYVGVCVAVCVAVLVCVDVGSGDGVIVGVEVRILILDGCDCARTRLLSPFLGGL